MAYKQPNKINNRGEKNPNRKLTDKQVVELRFLHQRNSYTLRQLAKRFEISHTQVYRIVNLKSRTNV